MMKLDEVKYIGINITSGMPYCFFNGKAFNYKNEFERNIKIDFFENYFKYNFNNIKTINSPFFYLAIISNNNSLRVFKLYCKNHFNGDRYENTSIVMYENLYEHEVIKNVINNIDMKKIDINLINFESKNWTTLWLYSIGFSRRQLAKILNINCEAVNKRLFRIKRLFKNCYLDELRSFIRNNGIIYEKVPKEYKECKLIKLDK